RRLSQGETGRRCQLLTCWAERQRAPLATNVVSATIESGKGVWRKTCSPSGDRAQSAAAFDAGIAESGEAKQQHRPGRRLGDGRREHAANFNRERIRVGAGAPTPDILAR